VIKAMGDDRKAAKAINAYLKTVAPKRK